MMRDIAAILWPLVIAYAVWRMALGAERIAERAIQAWAAHYPPPPAAPYDADVLPTVVVPDDLLALAMTQSEAWAQEDTIRSMKERYIELKDWQKVRFAFGIGRIDG